jgi:hypothetical protein
MEGLIAKSLWVLYKSGWTALTYQVWLLAGINCSVTRRLLTLIQQQWLAVQIATIIRQQRRVIHPVTSIAVDHHGHSIS